MRTLKKTLILSLAFGLSLLALSLGTSPSASAESETSGDYVYIAKAGDSYTELARSSVIKFDQSTDEFELNTAQVTAAETWVTQEAGSPQINLGSQVTVSKASVEKFAKQAAELTDSAKGRWQKYADASSISVGELKDKVRSTVSEDTAQAEEQNESDQQKSTEEQSNNDQNTSDDNKSEDKKDDNKASRRWIVIAIVVLLVLAAVTLIRSSNAKDE